MWIKEDQEEFYKEIQRLKESMIVKDNSGMNFNR